jgi:hypothetical protein
VKILVATVNATDAFAPRPPHVPGYKFPARAPHLETMAKIFSDGVATEDPLQRYGYDGVAHARQASPAFQEAYAAAKYTSERTCWEHLRQYCSMYMRKCHPVKPRDYPETVVYSRMLSGADPVTPPAGKYEPADPPLRNPYPFHYADDNSQRRVIWDVRSMSRDTWYADNITLSPDKVLKPRSEVARWGHPRWAHADAIAATRPGAKVAIKGYLCVHYRHGAYLDLFHTGEFHVTAAPARRRRRGGGGAAARRMLRIAMPLASTARTTSHCDCLRCCLQVSWAAASATGLRQTLA